MPSPDSLDRLLGSWRPAPPDGGARLVADTLRAVRAARPESAWRRGLGWIDDVVQDWLPSPGALVPAMGAIVLLLGAAHLTETARRPSVALAIEWRDSVMKPSSPHWISAAYRDVASVTAPEHP